MAFGIPNIERAVSNFIEGGTGITGIRSVDWGKTWLWTLKFLEVGEAGLPRPFDEYFPAASVSLPVASLETMSVPWGQENYTFPIGSKSTEMSITFYDNEKGELLRWIKDWIDYDILNYGYGVSGLHDRHIPKDAQGKKLVPQTISTTGTSKAGFVGGLVSEITNPLAQFKASDKRGTPRRVQPLRIVELVLLNNWRKTAWRKSVQIYPTGEITYNGTNDVGAVEYSVNFVIHEDMNFTKTKPDETNFFQEVKNVLGRFL